MLKTEKSIPDDITLFLSRILRRIEVQFGDGGEPKTKLDSLIHILQLESHYDRLDVVQQEGLGMFLFKLQQFWNKPIPGGVRSSKKLLGLVAAIKNNQFAICDEDNSTSDIGSVIYLEPSLLNHSCAPNAFPVFNGTDIIIKSLRKIEPDEEVTISYCDTKATTKDRQEYMNSIYRFNCKCDGCLKGGDINRRKMETLNGDVLKPSDPLYQSVEGMVSDMEEFKERKEWSLLNDAAQGWLTRKILPENNIYWVKLNEYAFDAAIETKSWNNCLPCGAMLIMSYKELYGSMHPTLGIHLMKFAKILLHLEKADEAEEYFRRAFSIISLFYEPESQVRKHLLGSILQAYEISAIHEEENRVNEEENQETSANPPLPKLKNLYKEMKDNGQLK